MRKHASRHETVTGLAPDRRNCIGIIAGFCDKGPTPRKGVDVHTTDCEVFVVGNPPPGFGGRYFIFVKLATNDGSSAGARCTAPPSARMSWPG